MTGLVIFGATILLLVLALEPAHRRLRRGGPRAGQTTAGQPAADRDQQRLLADLRDRSPYREAVQRRRVALPHLGRHSTVGAHGHRA